MPKMTTKRRRVVITLAFVAIVALTYVLTRSEKEPIYKGHRMSEWLAVSAGYEGDESEFNPSGDEFLEAVNATATDNIPLLVDWISFDTENALMIRVFELLPQSATQLTIFTPVVRSLKRKVGRANGAVLAFRLLKSRGAPAIPKLRTIIASGNYSAQQRAIDALVYIDTPAVPALLSIAAIQESRQSQPRFAAIAALSLHIDDPSVRTFLTNAAKDANPHVALLAQQSLHGTNNYGY